MDNNFVVGTVAVAVAVITIALCVTYFGIVQVREFRVGGYVETMAVGRTQPIWTRECR